MNVQGLDCLRLSKKRFSILGFVRTEKEEGMFSLIALIIGSINAVEILLRECPPISDEKEDSWLEANAIFLGLMRRKRNHWMGNNYQEIPVR
jgi:hypothetical protein